MNNEMIRIRHIDFVMSKKIHGVIGEEMGKEAIQSLHDQVKNLLQQIIGSSFWCRVEFKINQHPDSLDVLEVWPMNEFTKRLFKLAECFNE